MKRGTTFESAAARLDEILELMAREETPLDQSLKLYAEAAELIAFCSETLEKARITVEQIDEKLETAHRGDQNDVREEV